KFGRKKREEHFLLGAGVLQLLTTKSGRRVLQLANGNLRSRQLASESPGWSVLIDQSFQIDTDPDGDIIVSRGGDEESERFSVTVLRGTARLMLLGDAKDAGAQERTINVPAGVRVMFGSRGQASYFMRPNYRQIGTVFRQTS